MGCRRPARNSSPARGIPAISGAWPSARTANAWPALRGPNGEGVGCADRPGTPLPQGAHHQVHSVAFSPDGKRLASWLRTTDGEGLGCADRPGTPHAKGTGQQCSVAFSPDGKRLASASCGQHGEGVGCADRPGTPHLQGHAESAAWPSARTASAWPAPSADNTVKVWDATREARKPLRSRAIRRRVPSVAFSPDGKRLASASDDKTVKVWDVQTRPGDSSRSRGTRAGSAAWPSAPTASAWPVAAATGELAVKLERNSRCGMRRPARSC